MPIPNLNVVAYRGVANVQVHALGNGVTPNQIGSDVTGATVMTPTVSTDKNRLHCNYGLGSYIVVAGEAFEKDQGGAGNWGSVHSPTAFETTGGDVAFTSPHIVMNGAGLQLLCYAYFNTSGNLVSCVYNGTSWAEVIIPTAIAVAGERLPTRSIVYRNQIFFALPQVGVIMSYDPIGSSATTYSNSSTSIATCIDFAILNSELYAWHMTGTTAPDRHAIYRLEGAAFVLRQQTADSGPDGTTAILDGGPALFPNQAGTMLHCFANGNQSSNEGCTFWTYDPSGNTLTDNTNPVVPVALRPGVRSGADAQKDRIYVYMDTDTDPAIPEIYVFILVGPPNAGNYAAYKFISDATGLTSLGTSVAATFALPQGKFGGGEHIVIDSVTAQPRIISRAAVVDGTSYGYRVRGSGTDKTLKVYVSTDEEAPTVQAPLLAASGGSSVLNVNQVDSVTPDGEVTLYTVDVDWDTLGVLNGAPVKIAFVLS